MSNCLLETRALTKTYEDGSVQALRGVNVRIQAGEFVAISGASGSGKSTLLHMLGGLDVPTSGEVLFKGVSCGNGFDLDGYRAQSVGFVFQSFHLIPTLRAVENVQIPMFETTLSATQRRERAEKLLCEMGLEHRLNQYPTKLSAGERQRVAIARSLANEPEILLADAPTGNLDSENSAKIMAILADIQATRNMTLVIVTHENDIAASAQRHLRMRDGCILPQ